MLISKATIASNKIYINILICKTTTASKNFDKVKSRCQFTNK